MNPSLLPTLGSSPVAAASWQFAMDRLGCAIFNHSVRTYLHAGRAAGRLNILAGVDYRDELLFCACLLHDLGTATDFDGPQRFEVEGADAAARLLGTLDVPGREIDEVWQAIALHTSPGIAERLGTLPRLVRLGVLADFSQPEPAAQDRDTRQLHELFPRSQIELALADAVVAQAVRNPAKAPPSSWPGGLLRAHLERPDELGNSAF